MIVDKNGSGEAGQIGVCYSGIWPYLTTKKKFDILVDTIRPEGLPPLMGRKAYAAM